MNSDKEERKRHRDKSDSDSSDEPTKKHKKSKKHKKHKRDKAEKKHKKEKKESSDGFRKIDEDDFYVRNTEFKMWLLEANGLYEEDLDTGDAKKLFKIFVKEWNHRKLPEKFYNNSTLPANQRTKFQWGFASKVDQKDLEDLRREIHQDTNSITFASHVIGSKDILPENKQATTSHLSNTSCNKDDEDDVPTVHRFPVKRINNDDDDPEHKQELERLINKQQLKKFQKDKEALLEELVPKATGREAMIEKKKQKSQYTRSNKDDQVDEELRDDQMFGADDIRKKIDEQKERQIKSRQAKQEEVQKKLEEYRRRESEKLAPFLQLVAAGNIPLMQQKKPDQ